MTMKIVTIKKNPKKRKIKKSIVTATVIVVPTKEERMNPAPTIVTATKRTTSIKPSLKSYIKLINR
jgi:hypothetical protein